LTGGLAVEAAMTEKNATLAVSLALIHHNIVDWTFVDAQGKPEPVNSDTIETLLPYAKGGEKVANKAASLYLQDAIGPLGDRVDEAIKANNRPILAGHRQRRPKKSGSSSPAASDGAPSPPNP
jgi:hypothetical protein